jgi:hypothetical protein
VVNCGEKSSNAEGGACLGVIRGAVVTQKAREEVFPEDEVRAVVKTGITVAAQAEFVLIILHTPLFVSKFDSGSMAGTGDNTGSNCRSRSGIPVVSRSGGHRSSGVSDAGFTLCIKVFHFLDARRHRHSPTPPHHSPVMTAVIQTGHPDRSSRRGHMSKHTQLVFCLYFVSQVT